MDDAVYYGFSAAGRDIRECDVLITIHGGELADFVEGPSAGAATAVLTYSALEGNAISPQATITGMVDIDGNVQPVGGVYEKVRAAAQLGLAYFVMPPATLHDRVLLLPLTQQYNIQVFEVETAQEAIDFLLHGIRPPKRDILTDFRPIPTDLPPYASPTLEPFRPLAEDMIALEIVAVQKLPEDSEDARVIKSFFLNDLERQEVLLQNGYLFTTANEAFLNYIDAVTILNAAGIETLDLRQKKTEISNCLDSLEEKPKTMDNLEWLIGADLRKSWARERLRSIDPGLSELAEEKYYFFNQLQYAETWCFISQELRALAPMGEGEPLNESALRPLAERELEQMENNSITSGADIAQHAASARWLFNEGKYAASLYDSVFVLSAQDAERELLTFTPEKLDERFTRLLQKNRTALWANVYQSQGAYLSLGNLDEKRSAYRVLIYADELDGLHDKMLEELMAPAVPLVSIPPQPASTPAPSPFPSLPLPNSPPLTPSTDNATCATVYILAFAFAGGLLVWIRPR